MSLIPKLRFKEFKEAWIKELLGNLGTFKNGLNKESKEFGFGNPFVNLMDIFGKTILEEGNFGLVNSSHKDIETYNLVKGDVLFIRSSVKRSGVGEAILVARDLHKTVYSGFLIRFRDNRNRLDLNFKTYCFSNARFRNELLSYATSSANTNINQDSLAQIKLYFPSLLEQQKIASFLSAVDEKIQQLTRKKELLEQYKNGVMQQLFSGKLRFKDENGKAYPKWEEKRLGDVISAKSEKHNPQKETYSYRCIELEHVSTNTGMLLGYVDSSSSASIKNKFKKGDVLFGKLRPYLKKYLIAPFDGVCSSEIWVLSGKGITNEFLYRLIQTEYFIELANQSTGSKMPRAEWNVISSGAMKIPSLEEQQKIASFLSVIDSKIESVSIQIEQTQNFKKGLLQQMFV